MSNLFLSLAARDLADRVLALIRRVDEVPSREGQALGFGHLDHADDCFLAREAMPPAVHGKSGKPNTGPRCDLLPGVPGSFEALDGFHAANRNTP